MKKIIKKIGKSLFILTHREEEFFKQSVLVVDNGYSSYEYLRYLIKQLKEYRVNSDISVLTFEHRKAVFSEGLPDAEIILPDRNIPIKRYQLASQLFRLRKKKIDLVILPSLDISVLFVSLVIFNSKVVLYNQWRQWWSLKLKDITEFFKGAYARKGEVKDIKHFFKAIGLFYVLLKLEDKDVLRPSVLLVDNGYASLEHVICTINRIKEAIPRARISVLGLEQKSGLKERAPEAEFIHAGECVIEKYRIAHHMLRLRNSKYDYIALLSLDITPVAASLLFKDGRVVLHNQWFQWWSIESRPLEDYLMIFPRMLYSAVIFIYLSIAVCFLFLRKSFNIFSFSLLRKR